MQSGVEGSVTTTNTFSLRILHKCNLNMMPAVNSNKAIVLELVLHAYAQASAFM